MDTIQFSPPDITQAELDEAAQVLRSGWITTGPETKSFENEIAAYIGLPSAVCLNSATAALETTLRLLEIGSGDEVITSAYTYTASASVIDHVGAKIVLIDTLPGSYEMDFAKLEAAITEHTKAIIPVDIAGIPCDYDGLYRIVESKRGIFHAKGEMQEKLGRIAVISDCAHGFGAMKNGRRAGNFADFTCFSFHAVKNLTTAEGGAVVWDPALGFDGEDLYKRYMLMSLHGQNKDALAKNRLGAWEYDIVITGYKCNMPDICASIGRSQLRRYDAMLARRHEIISRYDAAFRPLGLTTPEHTGENYRSSGHLYLTRLPGADAARRNDVITKMAEEGVVCNVHYKPLPMMTSYKKLGFDIADYPNAFAQFENEVTLPLHTCLTDEQVEYIIEKYSRMIKD